MNTRYRLPYLFLLVTSSISSAAMAGGSAVVNVNANVVGTCLFNTDGAVSFSLDPSSTTDVNGTVTQPQFWCTNGTTYTITDDGGLQPNGTPYEMAHTSLSAFIPYSFSYTASGTGGGKNNPINMDITATVANADFVDAPAGNYLDTVTLTINP